MRQQRKKMMLICVIPVIQEKGCEYVNNIQRLSIRPAKNRTTAVLAGARGGE